MNEIEYCPHCGAKMVEHTHGLTKGVLRGLYKVFTIAGRQPINLKECGLTRNQWDNFQKLRYFDLVEQVPPGKKTGVWRILELGEKFLFGEVTARKRAITYRGERVRFEGPLIRFSEATGYYFKREDYAAMMRPHKEE